MHLVLLWAISSLVAPTAAQALDARTRGGHICPMLEASATCRRCARTIVLTTELDELLLGSCFFQSASPLVDRLRLRLGIGQQCHGMSQISSVRTLFIFRRRLLILSHPSSATPMLITATKVIIIPLVSQFLGNSFQAKVAFDSCKDHVALIHLQASILK